MFGREATPSAVAPEYESLAKISNLLSLRGLYTIALGAIARLRYDVRYAGVF
jgi:hypothetical protein